VGRPHAFLRRAAVARFFARASIVAVVIVAAGIARGGRGAVVTVLAVLPAFSAVVAMVATAAIVEGGAPVLGWSIIASSSRAIRR